MRVESKEEQHEKDMAAATTAPTGNVDKVAQSIARTITAESVDEAKRLAVAKMKRSYDLATSMKAKGLISEAQIKAKADEFFSLSDDAFESVIRVVEGLAVVETVKTASAVASLGQVNGSTTLPASSSGDAPNNLKDRLDTLWNTPSKGVKFF